MTNCSNQFAVVVLHKTAVRKLTQHDNHDNDKYIIIYHINGTRSSNGATLMRTTSLSWTKVINYLICKLELNLFENWFKFETKILI